MSRQAMTLVIAAVVANGCAKKEEKGDSAGVSVVFSKQESAALLDATEGFVAGQDLSALRIKPIAVGIGNALDSNSYMIWGSKNCTGEKNKVKIDDKSYDYFVYQGGSGCAANADDAYLDMLDPAALNATLNSQVWPVPPGTYHYVKLVFCSDGKADGINNLMYAAPGMDEVHEVVQCDPFIGYNAAGIVVPEGGALTVNLAYNLDRLIDSLEHSPDMPAHEPGPSANGCYWTPDGMTQYCPKFGQDALVPSILEE